VQEANRTPQEDVPDFSIVIPAYNEATIIRDSIHSLCTRLDKFSKRYEIIVAENGSNDDTADIVRRLILELPQVRLLQTQAPNYGAALRAGIITARGRYIHCDEIDICDADFHRRALELFVGDDGGFDLVIGSKTMRGARDRRPLGRRAATSLINMLLRVSLGFRGTDTHGLKALRRDTIISIVEQCVADGDMFASELVIRAERARKRIVDIPLDLQENRPTSIRLIKRVPRALKNIVQLVYVIRFQSR
jgi:glycosyltransferase involved in cell wall biosynthesis